MLEKWSLWCLSIRRRQWSLTCGAKWNPSYRNLCCNQPGTRMCVTAIMSYYFSINHQLKQNKKLKDHRVFFSQDRITFMSLDKTLPYCNRNQSYYLKRERKRWNLLWNPDVNWCLVPFWESNKIGLCTKIPVFLPVWRMWGSRGGGINGLCFSWLPLAPNS